MKQYFAKVSNATCPKNNLELSIQNFLKDNDRLIIQEKDLKNFKENIKSHIVFLNQLNKRCSAKVPCWYEISAGEKIKDSGLAGIDCISFTIYQISREYEITKHDN